jgi:hypothetical protein
MTRPTTKLLLAGLIAAAFLATSGVGTAGAVIRNYSITFSGGVAEAYTASDGTAFDIQRAGYVGCDYSQNGDLTVHFKSVWHMKADVKPRTAHVHVLKIKRVSGPFDSHHPGDSEISGQNSDEGPSTQCSDGNRAGSYDCTAEAVRPFERDKPTVTVDPVKPKTDVLSLPAFSGVRASYSGQAPSGFGCASTLGTNLLPGGFVSADFLTSPADITVSYGHAQLTKLHGKQKLHDPSLVFPESDTWDVGFAATGDDCALHGDGQDEVCNYTATTRAGVITVKRIG